MIEQLIGTGIAEELVVVVISMLPTIELRGALPVALGVFHMPWYWAFLLSIIGNMIPVPFLLLFWGTAARIVSKVAIGKKLVDWILERTRRRSKIIERYERIGLVLFVAIPLPMTGAWTGSIAAFLMGLNFRYSIISIFTGVIIAGIIVTGLFYLGWFGVNIISG